MRLLNALYSTIIKYKYLKNKLLLKPILWEKPSAGEKGDARPFPVEILCITKKTKNEAQNGGGTSRKIKLRVP
jgi:hypothetical protein